MKSLISILIITLMSSISFAGNGGGTLHVGAFSPAETMYVKYLGKDRADLVFEIGQVNSKNEMYTEVISLRTEEIKDQNLFEAIAESKDSNDWAEVK